MSKKKISAHPSGPGVWMPKSTLDSPAWRALSDGAQRLYIALKAKADNKHNTAYLSTREAATALGRSNRRKIREWYAELEHYGFIIKLRGHSLGVEGKGKAPLWQLTDKGTVRGGFEAPTQEFLRWDGVLFDPAPYRDEPRWKTEPRNGRGYQGGTDAGTTPGTDGVPLNGGGGTDAGAIYADLGGTDAGTITSINHYQGPLGPLSSLPKITLRTTKSIVAHFNDKEESVA